MYCFCFAIHWFKDVSVVMTIKSCKTVNTKVADDIKEGGVAVETPGFNKLRSQYLRYSPSCGGPCSLADSQGGHFDWEKNREDLGVGFHKKAPRSVPRNSQYFMWLEIVQKLSQHHLFAGLWRAGYIISATEQCFSNILLLWINAQSVKSLIIRITAWMIQ